MAAESVEEGGKFSDNRNAGPLGVSGSNSTFANENTSGAIRLDPATDAEARGAQDESSEEKPYPDALGGQAKDLAVEKTPGSNSTGETSSSAGVAPSYVHSQNIKDGKPKGKNLTEGGFESDDTKNASFSSEIGSKDDPGRLAELKIERENADSGGDAAMPRQQGTLGDNEYDALSGDTPA